MVMKLQRLLVGLSLLNLALLLLVLLSRTEPLLAAGSSPVLRGSALEIVDDQGRVRASIKVQPTETFGPTGRKYPETVVLRLVDPNGRPEVKIMASEEGGGLSFVGDTDDTRVLLHADGASSLLRLTSRAGRQQLIRP
jgi:hypothetical protein